MIVDMEGWLVDKHNKKKRPRKDLSRYFRRKIV